MSLVERWLSVRHLILPSLALSAGTHNEDDIVSGLYTGRFSLWISDCGKAALVTEITVYPRVKVLMCFLAGGDLPALQTMEDRVVRFAGTNGCAKVRAVGRRGWQKVFSGLEVIATVMEKDIGNGT